MNAGPTRAPVLHAPADDAQFASEFFAHYWGKRPVVIKAPFARSLISETSAFEALVTASDSFRASTDVPQLRVNVDGGFLLADMEAQLPRASDASATGYAARLRPWLGERAYFITLNEYHRYDLPFWQRLRKWLRTFYAHAGVPSGFFLPNLWFGIYERTPIGIHTDHAESFAYLIGGHKKLLVWPYEVFASRHVYRTPGGDHLGTTRYEAELDTAILLEGGPGDLLYWPESYWHIAVSDGVQPTLSCNWAYVNRELPRGEALDFVVRELAHLARAELGDRASVDSYPFDRAVERAIPAALNDAQRVVASLAGTTDFSRALQLAWLNRYTGLGLREPPPTRDLVLREDDRICGDPEDPIVLVAARDELLVSAHGITFSAPNEAPVRQLVEELNRGRAWTVRELEQHVGRQGLRSSATTRLLLEQLASTHALTIVRASKLTV